ncbi:GGDEF domain-containing protein [Vibrio aquaticus]|uniref:GGDEF domain-containing protein n=1 Tax=Vibrio aquaticus TaxID=2496559 RepID=A0A432D2F7_9VIBR|nr:GGDEF domain-containing protein [Vibrio aquaticus]RTZ18130.1 GGDEF domain-containing protein [Vibrio aquaticus]
MPQLAGRQIEEMADIRATRKSTIVLICSMISLTILGSYALLRFIEGDYFLSTVNLFSSFILAANVYYLIRHRHLHYCDLVLSCILLFQGVVLLFYGEQIGDRLLWFYPILAVLIFANDFKLGALLSTGFCALTIVATQFPQAVQLQSDSPQSRFLLSLCALCLLCNIFAYYYAKVMAYIQTLYNEGIEDLAYLDQLTGLANRWSFENWASGKLNEKRHSNDLTALVFIDIDNFKVINDSYGHDVGDRVLQHFAKRLRNNIRNKDRKTNRHDYSIARFAGDEFVVLLYDVKAMKDLEGIMQRICQLFDSEYSPSHNERINQLTVSVGVSLFPQDATTLSELTRCADKAMYSAKHAGKNQYKFYSESHLNTLPENKRASLANVTPIK